MIDITGDAFRKEFVERQKKPVDAIPTHLDELNRVCRDDGGGVGFARGWFVTVGGNPGFGKSAMALNLCSAALTAGEDVGFVSLEMSAGQLAARFYSIHSGVHIHKLERGGFDDYSWPDVEEYMDKLPSLYVPDSISSDWEDVVAFIQDCHDAGCKWFIIDYLQLIQTGNEENITRAITETVTELRGWAVNEAATVIALSQFNRQTSAEYHLKPRCQGLWGGMILEAASDLVLLLDHSRYRREEDNTAKTWVTVDKNRHGPLGDIEVEWNYRTLRMTEGLEHELAQWPGA